MLIVKPVESSEYIPVSDQYNCEVAGVTSLSWNKWHKSTNINVLVNVCYHSLIEGFVLSGNKKLDSL
jgi:hypothetical protein